MTWQSGAGHANDPATVINRSIASLKKWHPELEYHVAKMPDDGDLRCKAKMYDLSPFDETLFLDADTVVMGNLDYGFQQIARHGIALCISASPWARRYRGLSDRGDLVEYNTGVIFFRKQQLTAQVFEQWKLGHEIDSWSDFLAPDGVKFMPVNDQAAFAYAVDYHHFNPFVLPVNWNLNPTWQTSLFGPIKIYHRYMPPIAKLEKWNEEQSVPGAIIKGGSIS